MLSATAPSTTHTHSPTHSLTHSLSLSLLFIYLFIFFIPFFVCLFASHTGLAGHLSACWPIVNQDAQEQCRVGTELDLSSPVWPARPASASSPFNTSSPRVSGFHVLGWPTGRIPGIVVGPHAKERGPHIGTKSTSRRFSCWHKVLDNRPSMMVRDRDPVAQGLRQKTNYMEKENWISCL
jgi:hypothetical protein